MHEKINFNLGDQNEKSGSVEVDANAFKDYEMLEEAKEGDVDDTEEESSKHEVICIQKKYL